MTVEKTTTDKTNLPSRHVTEGAERAPHRSYLYAMGVGKEEIHQPLVGVVSTWNEAAPCNISLMRQAAVAKQGCFCRSWHAARIHHHHCDRRHCDGASGDEILTY